MGSSKVKYLVRIRIFGVLFALLVILPEKAYATSPVVISNLNGITNLTGSYALNTDVDATFNSTLGDFSGQLDGQGFRISNLASPIFNELLNGAVIRNLNLEDVEVTGAFLGDVGALANRASGTISLDNIGITGEVTGTGITGGLIGAYRHSSTAGIPGDTTFITLNRINLADLEVSGSSSSGGLFGLVDISINKQLGITCSNACGGTNNTDSINDSNMTGVVITNSEFRNLLVNTSSQGASGGIIGDYTLRNNTETFVQSNFSNMGGNIETSASITNNGKSLNNGSTIGLDLSDSIFENITVENTGLNTESNNSGGLIGNMLVSSSAKSNSKVFAFTGLGDASYIGMGQVINSPLAYAMNRGDISAINLSHVNVNDLTIRSSNSFAGLVVGNLGIEKTVETEALILLNGSTASSSGTVINEANATNTGNLRVIDSVNLTSSRNQVFSSLSPMEQNVGNLIVNQGTTTRAATDLYRSTVFSTIPGSNSGVSSNRNINLGSTYRSNTTNSNNGGNSNFSAFGLSNYFMFKTLPVSTANYIDFQVVGTSISSVSFESNWNYSKIVNTTQMPITLSFNLPTNDQRQVWIQIDGKWQKLGYANKIDGLYKIPNLVFKQAGAYKIGFLSPDISIDNIDQPDSKDLDLFELLVSDLK
jgi:hypothetical protein